MATKKNVTVESEFKPSIIHVETTKDGQIRSQATNVNFEILLRMLIPVIVKSAKQIYETAVAQDSKNVPAMTPKALEELKLTMYDTMNIAFSNALDMFAPEIEARPNLTAEAILRAQNEILNEEMQKAGYNPTEDEIAEKYEAIREAHEEEEVDAEPVKLF